MKLNRRELSALALLAPAASAQAKSAITHGPFLGHVTATSVWVWGRTLASDRKIQVRYGTRRDQLDQLSEAVVASSAHDCSAWVEVKGLTPNTRYYYQLVGGSETGTFRTIPVADSFRDPDTNPRGLFNFSFAFGSCADQKINPDLPTYKTLLDQHGDKLLFSVMNGDWLYEEKRDFTLNQWLAQTRIETPPAILGIAPSLTGVWENYKLYLERGQTLSAWHRNMPGYFTPDDHEILNDVFGTATAGIRTREATFRDIAVQAWYDYIAGSNPTATRTPTHFGYAELKGDILQDSAADFSKLNFRELSNLHIHWGGQQAGLEPNKKVPPGHPDSGVYSIVEVVDKQRLRISPPTKSSERCSYSIGRHNYASFEAGNVAVYLLDTRGLRDMHDVANPGKPGMSMLGRAQREWLKASMAASKADFFFIASSVNLMIPHVGTPGSTDPVAGKDDAWTAFLAEREELIQFWDSLKKPVIIMTGDLHNSWVIKVTDTVWECAAGPHNSQNHPAISEGSRPPNGKFNSRGRECEIRWSSYIRNDTPARLRRWPIYAIAQINNVFPSPTANSASRWAAYPRPHVVIQYFHGVTGDLLYAEPIHLP